MPRLLHWLPLIPAEAILTLATSVGATFDKNLYRGSWDNGNLILFPVHFNPNPEVES